MVKKRERVLYRTSGYTLRIIRNSIKTSKKKTSSTGRAPYGKTRALKKNSRFEVEVQRGDAYIGFVSFPGSNGRAIGARSVPAVIMRGGREKVKFSGKTISRPDGSMQVIGPVVRQVTYGPRPITDPAREPAISKMKEIARTTPL